MENEARALAGLLAKHRGATVLTGAGVSTESGIQDFRSPGTGIYRSIDPAEYLSASALDESPGVFWRYFSDVFAPIAESQPNAGHLALARLERFGLVASLITQNIDGLHQKAGSVNVCEIHGHLRTVTCTGCGRAWPLARAVEQIAYDRAFFPECDDCSCPLRPDVVLFGDPMPDAFTRAADDVRRSPLLLVVGSSLTVSPANTLAMEAERLVIVNREPTPADARADLVARASAGALLSKVADLLGCHAD